MHKHFKLIFSFLFYLLPFSILFSQDTEWNKLLEEWRTAYNVPGMSVGIIREGEVILSEGFGTLEEGKNIKPDGATLYAIASNTKAFISAAIAQLVEEGKLQ